jgi:hypothetical protein
MADKHLINKRMNNDRLEFARQNAYWEVKEWKKVMFNDETHFELRLGNKSFCCRRAKGTDLFDPKFTRKRVKYPPKVMIWGCFSCRGRGGLEFLKPGEMMNETRYRQVLEDKLDFFMNQHGTTHFPSSVGPDEEAAEGHLPRQPGAVEGGYPEAEGYQDGGRSLPQEPGEVRALATPGGDKTGWHTIHY